MPEPSCAILSSCCNLSICCRLVRRPPGRCRSSYFDCSCDVALKVARMTSKSYCWSLSTRWQPRGKYRHSGVELRERLDCNQHTCDGAAQLKCSLNCSQYNDSVQSASVHISLYRKVIILNTTVNNCKVLVLMMLHSCWLRISSWPYCWLYVSLAHCTVHCMYIALPMLFIVCVLFNCWWYVVDSTVIEERSTAVWVLSMLSVVSSTSCWSRPLSLSTSTTRWVSSSRSRSSCTVTLSARSASCVTTWSSRVRAPRRASVVSSPACCAPWRATLPRVPEVKSTVTSSCRVYSSSSTFSSRCPSGRWRHLVEWIPTSMRRISMLTIRWRTPARWRRWPCYISATTRSCPRRTSRRRRLQRTLRAHQVAPLRRSVRRGRALTSSTPTVLTRNRSRRCWWTWSCLTARSWRTSSRVWAAATATRWRWSWAAAASRAACTTCSRAPSRSRSATASSVSSARSIEARPTYDSFSRRSTITWRAACSAPCQHRVAAVDVSVNCRSRCSGSCCKFSIASRLSRYSSKWVRILCIIRVKWNMQARW